MSAFDDYLVSIIDRAALEARDDGSDTVEAHHMLLAMAAEPEPTVHRVLDSAELDYAAIRDALDREFEHSLSAAGVSVGAGDLPQATAGTGRTLRRLGATAKLAVERGFGLVTRKKDMHPAHLLAGILEAGVGTVPRALTLTGIDPGELRDRALRAATDHQPR